MKKALLSIFLFIFATCGFAQTTEQINPQDPNYNVELNAILQTLSANTTSLSQSVATTSSYFTGSTLSPAYGGTGQNSTNWATGDIVYMSSTGVWAAEVYPHGSLILTSSGTFTSPITGTVYVTMVAGGGGGGGGTPAGGGGGGQGVLNYPIAVTANTGYTVTVGAAGTGGVPNNGGTDGTATVFGTVSVAYGTHGSSSAGTGGGGSLNGSGAASGSFGIAGGNGVSSAGGGGGGGSILGTAGAGYGYGGAGNNSGTGANGGPGIVIIQW